MRTVVIAVALAGLVAAAGCKGKNKGDEIRVAVAANLSLAMEDIVPRFEKATGKKVTLIQGSSGKLAAQIAEGAPFDVFLAANVGFVDEVIESGDCLPETKRLYALGRLAMWAGPERAPPALLSELTDERFVRIAIANPETAPYGRAAKQALEGAGLWNQLKPRVVYGSNIVAAMQYVEQDNAEVGIISLSLATKADGTFSLIPEDAHAPIEQALAVCKGGSNLEGGKAFDEFLKAGETRQLIESYGFSIPK